MGKAMNSFMTPLMVNKTLHGMPGEKQNLGLNEQNYNEGENIGIMTISTIPSHVHIMTENGIMDMNDPGNSKGQDNSTGGRDDMYKKIKTTMQ